MPPTASLKHYHLALRRIARNVSRPNRRAQPSNLAATLVLAFYEVWNSDHDKWSRHLLGARLIIKEIPYAEMTRTMMRIKIQQRMQDLQQPPMDAFGMFASYEDSSPLNKDWDLINVQLLSTIMGRDCPFHVAKISAVTRRVRVCLTTNPAMCGSASIALGMQG